MRAPSALALLLALGAPTAADAGRPRNPVLIQITQNTVGEVWSPNVRSAKGDSVAFVSDGDVMGPGTAPGHREVYLYDLDSRSIIRVTTTTDGESYDAARETDDEHSNRSTIVAFISTGDLDPSVGNADHNPELFIWLRDTGELRQLTDTQPPVVNAQPYASDSGRCIVFRSSGDLDDNDGSDGSNPGRSFINVDGSDEVFKMWFPEGDFETRVVTQVSNGPPGTTSGKPVVGGFWFTRQCRSTSYESNYDQLGNGSTGDHIYNYTRTSGRIEQVSPPGSGINRNPAISSASNFARGPFVSYESDMDPIGNGMLGTEIFSFRLFKPLLMQFTFQTGSSGHGTISDGGGIAAFHSSAELVDPDRRVRAGGSPPFNADGNSEIFRAKGTRRVMQLTESAGCENTDPTIRDTGRAIAFRSTCNLVPSLNPAGVRQIFYWREVHRTDPLNTTAGCTQTSGCCNRPNGCYELVDGARSRPTRARIRPDYASDGGS